MSIARYPTFNLFNQLQGEMDRLLRQGVAASNDADDGDQSRVVTSQWTPAVDIQVNDTHYTLTADVPGVNPADIEITMDRGVLTIKGERQWASDESKDGFRRVERARGTFHRRFSLPEDADGEQISANGKDGVLEVRIPKQEQAQPRRIPVAA